MTKEDWTILYKDLCARLPYEPKVHIEHDVFYDECEPYDTELNLSVLYNRCAGMEIKPYLRSLSSMTIEERKYLSDHYDWGYTNTPPTRIHKDGSKTPLYIYAIRDGDFCYIHEDSAYELIDFFNEHHFDYRGLIPKGLAIEAPDKMYKFD